MKAKIITLGILILSLSTYSQSSKIEFGLKGGVNIFNFRTEQSEKHLNLEVNSKFNVGFFKGIFVNYSFNDKIQIQIEPNFQKKQTELSIYDTGIKLPTHVQVSSIFDSETNFNKKNKFKESSIESPLVIRYSIIEKLKLECGLNIAYILKEQYDEPPIFGIGKTRFNVNEFETGLIIGGIYNVSKKFFLNFRYNYGLNKKNRYFLNKRTLNIGVEYKL